jgi:hypothetical protein
MTQPPEEPPPSGLDIARQALAAAKAEAKRRGLRPGASGGRTDRAGTGSGDVPGRRRWRSDDDTRSGARPDERDPQTLDRALDRLVSERGGPGTVTRLTVHGPRGPSWTRGPLRVKGRGPRDTYG